MTTPKSKQDYKNVSYPEDREKSEGSMDDFSTEQRRAWLLDEIYRVGTPTAINQSETCKYFDVHQTTIGKDIDALGDYVSGKLGDNSKLLSDALYKAVMDRLLDEDPYKAAKTLQMFNEWLQSTGNQDQVNETDDIRVSFGSDDED